MSFTQISTNQPPLFSGMEAGSVGAPSPAPVKSARSRNRAAWWRQDLDRTAVYLMGQARTEDERAFVEQLDRVAECVKDLFGHWTNTYRIVRRSNVYQFRDPLPCAEALNSLRKSSKSENPTGHEIQELHSSTPPPKIIILNPQNQLVAGRRALQFRYHTQARD